MSVPLVDVRAVEAMPLSVPLATPLRTSFGAMDARSTLLIRVDDGAGRIGWGEVWCNFPTFGSLHRARIAETVVGPALADIGEINPSTIGGLLETRFATLALQTGEFGPVAQVIGGIEMAIWDLAGQVAGTPVHRLLGSTVDRVPAYASGINPTDPAATVKAAQGDGYRAFKLKVGFGRERDLENAAAVADALREGDTFMVDANQAWDTATAREMATKLAEQQPPAWLEEPLPANAPQKEWHAVADAGLPIAAGENLMGLDQFQSALDAGWLAVAQPDAGKWGGLAGGFAVAKRARAKGKRFCPHHLGGAVGLIAAAHLLAAAGGDGLLEVDSNENPLRTELVGPLPALEDGAFVLPVGPGFGISPRADAMARYRVTG
ncbi:MAG: mandelate racemase/muconate lactonizing enzyme family protein [Pseudomonadota bacterium]